MTDESNMQPLAFTRLSVEDSLQRSRAFLESMRTRRTVRDFSAEPVPFELIQNAVATASTAPSGANQQPWTFAVVSDPTLKSQIREAAEAEEKRSYEERMSQEWLDAIAHLGTDWQKPHLERAPYLIIVFAQVYSFRVNLETGEREKVKHYYVQESVGMAVGLLLASLHQAGLATLTHTPSPMKFLNDLLRRPDNERAYVVIPVGYPADNAHVPVITKKSLPEVMVTYGEEDHYALF